MWLPQHQVKEEQKQVQPISQLVSLQRQVLLCQQLQDTLLLVHSVCQQLVMVLQQ
jgi:hypothetical protein